MVVVGTDGSDSSLRAVDRAAAIAADHGAKLIVATAHLPIPGGKGPLRHPAGEHPRPGLPVGGRGPLLRDPARRQGAGAQSRGHERGGEADRRCSIDALVHLAEEVHADLLVVGNVGLSSVAGRLLGSVPSEVSRSSSPTC